MISSTYYHRGMRLEAGQIAHRQELCPFCGSGGLSRALTIQRDPDIHLMECSRCHGVFADSVPADSVFKEYYGSYYEQGEAHATLAAPRRFARRIYQALKIDTGRPCSILDFGGGDGTLSWALATMIRNAGCPAAAITIIDYNPETVVPSDPLISVQSRTCLEQAGGPFDIVIASSILEHLPLPVATLRQLMEKLAFGGFFYARHPYIVPLMKIAQKAGITIDFTYPAHLNDFGGDFWGVMLEELGREYACHCVFSRPSPVETSFRAAPLRTLVAYGMKSLWYMTRGAWNIVGGWEIGIVKERPPAPDGFF